jgi:hypothetical protein
MNTIPLSQNDTAPSRESSRVDNIFMESVPDLEIQVISPEDNATMRLSLIDKNLIQK